MPSSCMLSWGNRCKTLKYFRTQLWIVTCWWLSHIACGLPASYLPDIPSPCYVLGIVINSGPLRFSRFSNCWQTIGQSILTVEILLYFLHSPVWCLYCLYIVCLLLCENIAVCVFSSGLLLHPQPSNSFLTLNIISSCEMYQKEESSVTLLLSNESSLESKSFCRAVIDSSSFFPEDWSIQI